MRTPMADKISKYPRSVPSPQTGPMGALLTSCACSLFVAVSLAAQSHAQVTLAAEGWTVTADPELSVLSVAHEKLGTLLRDAHLNTRDSQGLHPQKQWTATQTCSESVEPAQHAASHGLGNRASSRRSEISSTNASAVFTAVVPAPPSRLPARLIDHQGAPVDWAGTNEW